MALRCRTLIAGIIFFAVIAVPAVVYFALLRKHRSTFFAIAEYWVYLPEAKLPPQDDIMTIMVQKNPYLRRGVSPIGPKEGLVFSDVRTHFALVLRSKNPHIFRPDQFEEHIKPTPELLNSLKNAKSLVKIRYASDIPLTDKRHLQFLIHAADAVAEIGNSNAIFDVKAERLLSRQDLQTMLKENFDATTSALHTLVLWKQSPLGGVAETRGLAKIGIADLRTGVMEPDQSVLAINVITEAVRCIWANGALPESVEVTTFDDTFKVQFEKMKDALTQVRILRVQAS